MTRPAARSLTLRAVLYVGLICAAIVGFEAWREWTAHDAALAKAELDAQNLARTMRQHAEDTYEIAEQAVSMVIYELGVTGLDKRGRDELEEYLLAVMSSANRLHAITLFGPDGRWLATTADGLPEGENHFEQTYFRNHVASSSSAAFIGGPITMGKDGTQVTTVSRRIENRDGGFAGVVVASIDSRYFSDLYDRIDVGDAGSITLLDSTGKLISQQHYRPELIGTDLSGDDLFGQRLAVSDTGAYHFNSPIDGVDRIGGFDRGTRYPVVAVVAVSHDEALASWGKGALLRGLLTLGFTLAVAVLGLRLAEQIRRRQKSEAVLEQKEAEFRLLAESASDLVERFDANGIRTYISPALERLTGYTPAELIGHSAFEVVHDDDRPTVEAAAERLRSGASEQETVQFRRVRKDGLEIWLETSLRVAAETSGRFSVVGVTRDITDRKQLEMTLEGMAMRDGLTGLANRRAFDSALFARSGAGAAYRRSPVAADDRRGPVQALQRRQRPPGGRCLPQVDRIGGGAGGAPPHRSRGPLRRRGDGAAAARHRPRDRPGHGAGTRAPDPGPGHPACPQPAVEVRHGEHRRCRHRCARCRCRARWRLAGQHGRPRPL
ncbi:MAG: PAS domain S-box protein [Rubrivivax sp.]